MTFGATDGAPDRRTAEGTDAGAFFACCEGSTGATGSGNRG
jgi:hypothetical protein